MPQLLILATGGTIFQKARHVGQAGAVMQLALTASELLSACKGHIGELDCEFDVEDLGVRSGAELSWGTIFRVRDAVAARLPHYAGALLITGTDTMEEFAFSLALLLDGLLQQAGKALAITGAMLPADQLGWDGQANLCDAIKVAAAGAADPASRSALSAVLVVMNNAIHLGRYVRKSDSQLIGAFQSHPGPLGQVRGGRPVLYYQPPGPPLPAPGEEEDFSRLSVAELRDRVPIWTLTAGAFLPEGLLEAGRLDGLVLAGSGTGSVPQVVQDLLSPKWTSRLPIVIVSRCATGAGLDDFYYQGSRAKYESRGFIVGGPYEHLNPLQARTLLIFRLSALGHG